MRKLATDRNTFRVWLIKEERYLPLFENTRYFLNLESGTVFDNKWSKYIDDVVIEQCTGYHDKTDELIYIGDKVRGVGCKYLVKFDEGLGMFTGISRSGAKIIISHLKHWEIVGSIHYRDRDEDEDEQKQWEAI